MPGVQYSTKCPLKLCNHLAKEERAYCFECDLNVLSAVLLCLLLGAVVYEYDISCSDSLFL